MTTHDRDTSETRRTGGGDFGRMEKGTKSERAARAEVEGATNPEEFFEHGLHLEESIVVNRPRAELFAFWRNVENHPRFSRHLRSVKWLDDRRSRWVAQGPAGTKVEWTAETINEEPDSLIAWRTVGDNDMDAAGSARFLDASGPDGHATEVKVVMDYLPPGGKLGSMIAKLFGKDPAQTQRDELRRFKELMETGRIADDEPQD